MKGAKFNNHDSAEDQRSYLAVKMKSRICNCTQVCLYVSPHYPTCVDVCGGLPRENALYERRTLYARIPNANYPYTTPK